MTTEEKAKAYDEALEVLKEKFADKEVCGLDKSVLQKLFPQLKESENERIRKELLNYLYDVHDDDEERARWISYLEKQGEHAKFYDSIQVGDKVTRNEDGVLVNLSQLKRVAKKDEKQCEQKSADKVEPKFHEGDMIIHKELGGDYIHNPHKIIQVDILDKKYRLEGGLVAHFCEQDDYELVEQKPADTEKGAKGNDREIPNSAWSEEDERMLNEVILGLKVLKYKDSGEEEKAACQREINWLEFLKERYTWKPSDGQLRELRCVISGCSYDIEPLAEMEEQLKKLREE